MHFSFSAARRGLSLVLLSLIAATGSTQAPTKPSVTARDLVRTAPKSDKGFVNFELPQVKPICVATIGDGTAAIDVLLVCNTPDNSVEIYDVNPPFRFIRRVPVGLGPVTVRYNAVLGKFYTCNFLGDSVSVVRLAPPTSPDGDVQAIVEQTTNVGDEPSDIAFLLDNTLALVTLNSLSALTARQAHDFALLVPRFDLTIPHSSGFLFAVKQPRMIQSLPDGRAFILNFMGDQVGSPSQLYDFDLYSYDPTSVANPPLQITGGMGTTNHSFAMSRDGSRMFVVGTRAQNRAAIGVESVSQLKTGFAQSHLWVVDIIPGMPPAVVPEAPAGVLPAPTLQSINLNRDYSVVPLTEVTPDLALSQPTDVLLVETGGPIPEIQKVFLTAYHSDKVAVLHPDSSVHGGWRINQIPISIPEDAKDYGMAGPRGLAFSPNAVDPATPTEPGLVFCANRLSNSISVINPHTEAVIAEFTLQHDPTPKRIRKGRKFLYSAAEFSGNGMVSCASCHVDGRTDGLNWNLGDLNLGPAIDPWFHDGNGESVESIPNFPSDKGRLATQTLQGLVNYRVNPQAQHLFSNAPYHWRGDKRGLVDFNEAFVNLQGMANIGLPENPKGVTDSEMEEFATFLNTIVHPGNFEQFYTRGTTGSLGADPNDPTQGSGALLGMKIYHVQPVEPRSCVQCHSLPDGSTNTATLAEVVEGTVGSSIQLHPFEAAATRNLVQREGILHRGFKIPGPPLTLTSNSGLLHAGELLLGVALSINDFLGNVFLGAMPGPTEADAIRQIEAVIEFQRQFDSGVAPLVGFGWTYVPGHPLNLALLRVLEEQVTQANLGLAVYTRSNGVEKGYYYDFSVFPPAYREVGTANFIPGEALDQIALEDDAVVILQATPMGSERRVANLEGKHDELKDKDNPPSAITLQPMAPGTAWVHITKFTAGVDPTAGAISLASLRALQDSVIGPNFGVPSLRHEPPRKFRVTGDNIRLGASLMLGMLDKDNPETIHYLWMPIFPTRNVADRRIIWETEAEADAMVIMTLLNGGPWAPGVTEVLHGILPPTTPLDPLNWNTFLVAVMNEDKSINEVVQWQTLTVQDGR